MFCENCGKQLPENSTFCSECGTKVSTPDITENTSVQQNTNEIEPTSVATFISEPVQEATGIGSENTYCSNCGTLIPAGTDMCPSCANGVAEPPAVQKKKKFSGKKVIVPIAVALVVAIVVGLFTPVFAYAKNSFMKLILSPEKYFAYVITSNADDFSGNFAKAFSTAKTSISENAGGNGKLEIKLEDRFADIVEDLSGEDISEYIDWLDSLAVSIDANNKDSLLGATYGLDLNGVNLGTIDLVTDMENQEVYVGIPDYNSQYLYASFGDSYYGYSEMSDVLQDVISAFPDEAGTKKLLTKYIQVVAKSIKDVEQSSEVIEADGISQRLTALTVDINGKTVKNVSLNFLEALKEDKELEKIVDDISDAVDADADEFWEVLDDAIDELDDMDTDDLDVDAKFTLYVNSKGDISGFRFDVEDVRISSVTTEKGSKFGSLVEIRADGGKYSIEGNGKISGDKRSGTFTAKGMGVSAVEIEIKDLDTKLLNQGIFNGSITIKLTEDAADLIASQSYGDVSSDVLGNLAITISSSSNTLEEVNSEISFDYKGSPCARLILTSSAQSAKAVSVPDTYADTSDDSALEDWVYNLDLSSITEKLRKAKLPEHLVSEIETAVAEFEESLSYDPYEDMYYDDYDYYYDDDYDYDYSYKY